jgi:hypothetical protein
VFIPLEITPTKLTKPKASLQPEKHDGKVTIRFYEIPEGGPKGGKNSYLFPFPF